MGNRILYQAVEDRNNPDYVEQNGPFWCNNKTAWLGHGYYFWDTFIEHAHWWGGLNYKTQGYIICQSSCEDNSNCVYDLVSNPELFYEIEKIATLIEQANNVNTVYVPEIIEYLKSKTSFLQKYKAIRANPLCTRPNTSFRYKFNDKNKAFIDTRPAIQYCILDKTFFNSQYHIVYPEMYCADYVI